MGDDCRMGSLSRQWFFETEAPPGHELTEAIRHSLRVGDFRSGELLAQAQNEILFHRGGELAEQWDTFENYVAGALRISKSTAYRKIFAFEFVCRLKQRERYKRIPLPTCERQVRPLQILKNPEAQIEAWEKACLNAQSGQATARSVLAEVNRLNLRPAPENDDAGHREYNKNLRQMAQALRRATEVLVDGDMEGFLLRAEINGKEGLRLASLIKLVSESQRILTDHLRKLHGLDIDLEE
jgi:hypothetical protein